MNKDTTISFDEYLEETLENDELLREEWEKTEAEYNILRVVLDTRVRLNLTQQELAKRCGIDQSDLSKIERGVLNPSVKILKKIAKGLGKKLKIEFVD